MDTFHLRAIVCTHIEQFLYENPIARKHRNQRVQLENRAISPFDRLSREDLGPRTHLVDILNRKKSINIAYLLQYNLSIHVIGKGCEIE